MAYSHGGTVQWGTTGKWSEIDPSSSGYWIGNTSIGNVNYGLAIKWNKSNDKYYIYAKPLNDSVKNENLHYDITAIKYDKDGNVLITNTVNQFLNLYPSFTEFNGMDTGEGYGISYNTIDIHIVGIPIFDNDSSLQKYLENGE